jgi:hypothetical protein
MHVFKDLPWYNDNHHQRPGAGSQMGCDLYRRRSSALHQATASLIYGSSRLALSSQCACGHAPWRALRSGHLWSSLSCHPCHLRPQIHRPSLLPPTPPSEQLGPQSQPTRAPLLLSTLSSTARCTPSALSPLPKTWIR